MSKRADDEVAGRRTKPEGMRFSLEMKTGQEALEACGARALDSAVVATAQQMRLRLILNKLLAD
jgi:hypothetical protein